jgi:CRISPR-associated endoribonuclease Cas6
MDSQVIQRISGSKRIPFTFSPLFGKVDRGGATREISGTGKLIREGNFRREPMIRAGTPCRLRVSILEDSVGKRVEGIFRKPDKGLCLSLGDTRLKVTDMVSGGSTDPWVSHKGYKELYEDASPSVRDVTLQFVTATAFERIGASLPLPDPQLVFRGYLDHWRWFSFIPLSSDLKKVIDQSILLTDFNISPASHELDEGRHCGFTGWCRFLLMGRRHERHIRDFNALTDYAYYCGTGINTSMGMGVTRRI